MIVIRASAQQYMEPMSLGYGASYALDKTRTCRLSKVVAVDKWRVTSNIHSMTLLGGNHIKSGNPDSYPLAAWGCTKGKLIAEVGLMLLGPGRVITSYVNCQPTLRLTKCRKLASSSPCRQRQLAGSAEPLRSRPVLHIGRPCHERFVAQKARSRKRTWSRLPNGAASWLHRIWREICRSCSLQGMLMAEPVDD